MKIIGIDPGNYESKMKTAEDYKKVLSCLGEWRERKLVSNFSRDDMEWEYQGKKGFAGTLAKYESDYSSNRLGDTKAHDDAKIRILLSCWQMCRDGENIKMVVGQPISKHTADEKNKIKNMLLGHQEITVNGISKRFYVDDVAVAAETATSILAKPTMGVVNIIDVGAGTIGLAKVDNMRFIDRDSCSLNLGADSTQERNLDGMTTKILNTIGHKWNMYDKTYVIGGMAEEIQPYLADHFSNIEVMLPIVNGMILPATFSNVIGFYNLGVGLWQKNMR